MHSTLRSRASWTAIVGLLLLWAAFIAVAFFAVVFTLWMSGVSPAAPLDVVLTAGPALLMLAVLVCATLRQRWARWTAVVLGVGGGLLGLGALLVTLSPAPETVAMSAAAIVGGVLLALPASGTWFGSARPAL